MIVLSVKHHESELVEQLKDKIGADVMTVSNASLVPDMTKSLAFPVWVIDIGLPKALESIRQMGNAAVIATTHNEVSATTAVLLIGHANELLQNPSTGDIVAAVMRHTTRFSANGYTVDTYTRQVWYQGKEFTLTPTRFDILSYLIKLRGAPSTYTAMAREVYNEVLPEEDASARLKTHVHNLRKDLEEVSGFDPLTTSRGHVFWLMR